MAPTIYSEIISKLPEGFNKANESGDLLFFPSTLHKHAENGVEFEIRLCPALQEKPNIPAPRFDSEEDQKKAELHGKKTDPFAPPYVPNLLIGELKDEEEDAEYVVLFNKYAVVPHHILVVTKEFQSQTAPLLPPDLVQTYRLLLAARDAGRNFFAFYNCGNLSGASQPHKHLQLIPIESDGGPPIEKLARESHLEVPDKPFSLTSLPYANHVRRLPLKLSTNQSISSETLSHELSSTFLSLLDLSISTIRHSEDYPTGPPSYNVILTLEHMHLIPRKEETHVLEETGERLNVNALGFAGMLLVKSDRELEAVKKEGVPKILGGLGLKSIHDLQVKDLSAEAEDHIAPSL
ncbi:HIT-like domain-containing protein [Abortiporus biennis]|nr:HIT-like domain-containing protein [Abortiporus biennis]